MSNKTLSDLINDALNSGHDPEFEYNGSTYTFSPNGLASFAFSISGSPYINLNSGHFSGTYDVSGNTNLLQIDIEGTGFTAVDVSDCTNLILLSCGSDVETVDVTNCTSLETLRLTGATELTSLDVSDCTSLVTLVVSGSGLTSLNVSGLLSLVNLDGASCGFNQAAVNAILVALDSNNASNGVVDLTNNAIPSGAGATAVTSLTGKGWTVSVDS